MREKAHREQNFIREQDSKLDSTWDWVHLKRDEIRQVLGFFIGEPPVDPFSDPTAHWPPAHPDPRRVADRCPEVPTPRPAATQYQG